MNLNESAKVPKKRILMALKNPIKKLLLAELFALLTLSGCTTPITPDFSAMSKKYANILEQYQIDMIFTNIIRASQDRPLSFLDMPNITGTGSITTIPALTTNFAGMSGANVLQPLSGALASVTPSLSMQIGNSFNFSQASLDNATFWKGFLTPISLNSAKYFIHNHIPKEVIFNLVIDEIVITFPDGKQKTYINNPLRPQYPEFQKEMRQLINYGLTVQSSFDATDAGPPMTEKELEKNYGANPRQVLAQNGMELRQVASKPVAQYQIVRLTPAFKICMQTSQFQNFVKQSYGGNALCELSTVSEAASKNKTAEPKLDIAIRSTKNIYDYLGQVTEAQLADPPYLVTLLPSDTTLVKKATESNRFALFVVNRNASSKSFASMDAADENFYSIPRENNGYSTMVINLLAQFQTLAKSPGSIPSSPAVLIK